MSVIIPRRYNKSDFFYLFIYFIFLIVATYYSFAENSFYQLRIIGILFIIENLIVLFQARKSKELFFLCIILGTLNFSLGYTDFFHLGEGVAKWQTERLRNSEYNIVAAKALFLFFSTFVLSFCTFFLSLREEDNLSLDNTLRKSISNARKDNKIISWGAFFTLAMILAYAILVEVPKHSFGSYESIDTPIYEYSVILYVLGWFYSKDNRFCETFLHIYAVIFIATFLLLGDRSSASMYLVALVLMFDSERDWLTPGKIIVIMVIGILGGNAVAVVRNGILQSNMSVLQVLLDTLERGIDIDTASWSYYSGLTSIAAADLFGNKLFLFSHFLLSIIGIHTEFSNMPNFAMKYSNYLFNRGGGTISSYFYAWFGFIGVFILAMIIGIIFARVFRTQTLYCSYIRLLIIIFSFRWYIYSPVSLFRSVFLIGSVLLWVTTLINQITVRGIKG